MAVSMVATIKRWQGLSTDDKPTTDVPEGSTYHAIDTGQTWVYHQDMWEPDLRIAWALAQVI